MKYTLSSLGQGNNEVSDVYLETADLIYKTRKIRELLRDAAYTIGSSTLRSYLELAGFNTSTYDIGNFPGIHVQLPHKKHIIGVDGINGAGKTTVLNKLQSELKIRGISARIMKPILSNSLYGSVSRSLFRDMYMSFDVFVDTLILVADHHYVISEVLPKVDENIVIFDRSKYSIIAVQAARMYYDENVPLDKSVETCARLCSVVPDFHDKIVINVDTETALKRLETERSGREVDQNRFTFDQRQLEIFKVVNRNYHDFVGKFELINVDGNKNIDEILDALRRLLF